MANDAPYGFRALGDYPPTFARVDITTAFTTGDPLVRDGSSPPRYELATASSDYVDAIAACASTGLADDDVAPVILCSPGRTFLIRCDGSMATVGVGSARDIIGATGAVMLDADATSKNVLIVENANYRERDDSRTTAGCVALVRMLQRTTL